MKILASLFILTFGIVALGFAQSNENRKHTIPELKNHPPQLMDSLKVLDFGKLEPFQLDSPRVFTPKSFFLDREFNPKSYSPQNSTLPYYVLPDPQSRMPIREFPDSLNYTLLKKEYK
jgi:hypothetical protein